MLLKWMKYLGTHTMFDLVREIAAKFLRRSWTLSNRKNDFIQCLEMPLK